MVRKLAIKKEINDIISFQEIVFGNCVVYKACLLFLQPILPSLPPHLHISPTLKYPSLPISLFPFILFFLPKEILNSILSSQTKQSSNRQKKPLRKAQLTSGLVPIMLSNCQKDLRCCVVR